MTRIRIIFLIGAVAALVAAAGAAFLFRAANNDNLALPAEMGEKDLKPVTGAFGWKLGERLPEQLRAQAPDGSCSFHPGTNMPPFGQFELEFTKDARIYAVKATGYAPDSGADPVACKQALISTLGGKYGLRHHQSPASEEELDTYIFGAPGQYVRLDTFMDNLFTLEYVDTKLLAVHRDELRAERIKSRGF